MNWGAFLLHFVIALLFWAAVWQLIKWVASIFQSKFGR
jgi:high-affinity Fe2+/Pb2+ permease